MTKPVYTNNQIEIESILDSISIDGKKVSSTVTEEIIRLAGIKEQNKDEYEKIKKDIDFIKIKLLEETDWKKKASLAALLISKSLED